MTMLYAMAGINLMLCMPCLFICICRLNAMQHRAKPPVRWQVKASYALGAGAFTLSAGSPWIGQWPGIDSLVLVSWALSELLSSRDAWRGDNVPTIASQHADLQTLDGRNS